MGAWPTFQRYWSISNLSLTECLEAVGRRQTISLGAFFWLRRLAGEAAKVLEGEEPSRVSVCPGRLKGVAADELPPTKLIAGRSVMYLGAFDISERVGFAAAGSAGTGAAKILERQIRLGTIIPRDCELVSDDGDVGRSKS